MTTIGGPKLKQISYLVPFMLFLILSIPLIACQEPSPLSNTEQIPCLTNNICDNISVSPIIDNMKGSKSDSIIDTNNIIPSENFSVADANNQLALDIYEILSKKEQNIFFSPYSILSALAMCYEGAREDTAAEIRKVSHLPVDDGTRRSEFASINDKFSKYNPGYKLSVANALWSQKGYPLLNEYINILHQSYGATAENLDFKAAPANSRYIINNWVADKTNNIIKALIPPDGINNDTRLVLTNTVYFKGTWKNKFDRGRTCYSDFHVDSATAVRVPFMLKAADYRYAEADGVQILEMDYLGDQLSMLVILPESNDLTVIEKKLSPEAIRQWRSKVELQSVGVRMPKYTITFSDGLQKTLMKLGMIRAFDPNEANFSGIDGSKTLSVQDIFHTAKLTVDEDGTEAAAATAITAMTGGSNRIFNADHPFLFLIQDKTNGNILFMGRVTNPNS